MTDAKYRCTLPECQCGEFTPGKTQLKTCDGCRHGWIAHDLISEAQAKKIRKKGTKDGTPCQNGNCACGNYQRPPGVSKSSWLAVCDNCKHSETEHRYPTKLDKTKKHNLEKAADHSCVGCEIRCPGFQQSDQDSSQKCIRCRHVIDTHRPATGLDNFISEELDACSNLRCHSSLQSVNKPARSSNWESNVDDLAFLSAWVEPTNIDHDEDVPFLSASVCQCKGFVFDDMARICNQYYGFTEPIVAPHLPNLACQVCSHALRHHRHHSDQELKQLDARKQDNLTMVGIVSVQAHSHIAYNNNVTLSLQEDISKATFKILLAASKFSNYGDNPIENVISVSSVNINPGHQGNHHHGNRLHSASSAGDEESQSDEEKENDVQHVTNTGSKKRGRKMSRIVDDVKRKIKKRKVGKSSTHNSEGESDVIEDEDPTAKMSYSLQRLENEVATISTQHCHVTASAWSAKCPGYSLAVATDDKTFRVYQGADTVLAAATFPEDIGQCTSISWLHSGEWLVTGHTCGTALLLKINTPNEIVESSIITHSASKSKVTSICISRDDRFIALGYQDSQVLIFDSKKVSGMAPDLGPTFCPLLLSSCSILYGAVLCMDWHPSKLLLVAGGEDDQVTVFFMKKPTAQTSRGSLKHYFTRSPRRPSRKGFHQCAILKGHKSFVGAVTFDQSGSFLVSAGWDGQLLFWNAADIDDAIESEDDAHSEIVCSSGFVMGRSSGNNVLNGTSRPFAPQAIAMFGSYVLVMLRTSVNRIGLAMYEMPKKYVQLSLKTTDSSVATHSELT